MKHITSKDNPIYKNVLKLTKKKHRDEQGLYLVEGVKPLQDAVKLGLEIEQIFIKESVEAAGFPEEKAVFLSDNLFNRLSETETSQGVIAVIRKNVRSADDIPTLTEGKRSIVILDRLQDPGNIGTIIRTAEAAGMAAVAVMPGTCDVYSQKVTRAAAGSLMRVPIIEAKDEKQITEVLHQTGLRLAITALEEAVDYRAADLGGCGIVIGNEGRGVSEEFLALADIKVKIPMQGEIESLNAAVAAGILMYTAGKVKQCKLS